MIGLANLGNTSIIAPLGVAESSDGLVQHLQNSVEDPTMRTQGVDLSLVIDDPLGLDTLPGYEQLFEHYNSNKKSSETRGFYDAALVVAQKAWDQKSSAITRLLAADKGLNRPIRTKYSFNNFSSPGKSNLEIEVDNLENLYSLSYIEKSTGAKIEYVFKPDDPSLDIDNQGNMRPKDLDRRCISVSCLNRFFKIRMREWKDQPALPSLRLNAGK